MRESWILIITAAIALALPVVALGQGGGKGEQAKQVAEEQFAAGKKLFAAGKYSEAAVAFTEAYEAAPHQAVLANIALCYDKAGKFPEAVTYYRRYIEDPVDKGKNAEIRKRLQELRNEVGEYDIECGQPQCSVRIDGRDRGPAPVNAVVEPGSHKIEGVVDGEVVAAVMERADGGTVVRVRLQPDKAGPVIVTAPGDYGKTGEEPADREVSLGVPFWVFSGVTVAAGAGTIVFGVRTLKARDEYEETGYTDPDPKEQGERDRLITNILIGVTAAAGATAVAFAIHDVFFADGDDEEPEPEDEPEPEVAIVPGPGVGLGVAARF